MVFLYLCVCMAARQRRQTDKTREGRGGCLKRKAVPVAVDKEGEFVCHSLRSGLEELWCQESVCQGP